MIKKILKLSYTKKIAIKNYLLSHEAKEMKYLCTSMLDSRIDPKSYLKDAESLFYILRYYAADPLFSDSMSAKKQAIIWMYKYRFRRIGNENYFEIIHFASNYFIYS